VRAVARALGVDLSPELVAMVEDGFGASATGEDAFDAVVGLLGTIDVVRGHRPADPPASVADACTVEGWILGLGPP
jgi:hypothetical protein